MTKRRISPDRRSFSIGLGAMLLGTQASAQQSYPNQTVRIIVPYAAGGGMDQIARLLATRMHALLGRETIVENKPGAGTMLGSRQVARSPADGHTLLLTAPTLAINPLLYRQAGYGMGDFAAVAPVVAAPLALSVASHVPARTLAELVDHAKANPGKLNFASLGPATITTMIMERLKLAAGIQLTSVPYSGSAPAVNAVLAGQVDVIVDAMNSALAHTASNRLRLLAVARPERSPMAPQTPTFAEEGYPTLTIGSWAALFAPANTPPAVVRQIRVAVRQALDDTAISGNLSKMGFDPWPASPENFPRFVEAESASWARDIRIAGMQPLD